MVCLSWKRKVAALSVAAIASVAFTARAEESQPVNVQEEIQALRAEVATLRSKSDESWLNERRAEELKTLIRDVLADADTRASMQSGAPVAGHNGKNFFLASEDGNFMLNIEGQIQFRYIWNHQQDHYRNTDEDPAFESTADETESGFQTRRTKLGFFGHVFDPKLTYKVKAAFERSGGAFQLEEAWAKYAFADQYYVQIGQFKGRFMHEELVSSSKQLAVERSNVNEFFTLDYSQGIEVGAQYNVWNWSVILHDGREADNVDFASDSTHFAVAGRAEYLLAGNWKQFSDFNSWSSDPFGVMVGVGIDYERGEDGTFSGVSTTSGATDWESMLQYTVDVSVDMHPFNFYAAYLGRCMEFDYEQGGRLDDSENEAMQWGVVAQVGMFIIPDKMDIFARYEHLDFNDLSELTGTGNVSNLNPATPVDTEQDIYTFGTNYYFKKHDLKVTLDVQWAPQGVRAGESGGGNITSNTDRETNQCVIRAQFQLLF